MSTAASASQSAPVYAVIMAGGSGTRFWPASREMRPKQLLSLGGGNETLLGATVRRLEPLVPASNVYVVTARRLAEKTAEALPGVPASQILREPMGRNTAPCIAWAAAAIAARDPNAVVAVLPSDHFIADEPAFRAVIERALASASSGVVTTVGIVPTRPETGYGYLELGEDRGGGVSSVARFVEKPDRARAEAFLAGKKHLWNAGMFFFRVKDMIALVEKHLPEVAKGAAEIVRAATTPDGERVLDGVFPTLQSISIDHGVMEKAGNLAVVSGSFGWNDVGSWLSSWELATKDEHGNALPDGAVAVDAKGNLVRDLSSNKKKTIAVVGVSDLVVVETDDALLVIPRDRAQDVRAVVDALKASKRGDLL
jgi:mannose-1-phosphate guanylyltransferase